MFVPCIPIVRVVNKNIVYCDTVIKLDSLGKDVKVTSVDNINEHDLERCIKCIFENNEDVLFNTVQYSRKDKKIYFYTDKVLDLTKWNNRNIKEYTKINNTDTLLSELNYLFDSSNRPREEDIISLLDVFNLFLKTKESIDKIEGIFEDRICNILKDKHNKDIYSCSLLFDYVSNELTLKYSLKGETKKIVFSKSNNDVFIVRSDDSSANKIFSQISSIICETYDELINFKYFDDSFSNYSIDVINSNLKASITNSYIGVYRRPRGYFVNKDFEISLGVLINSCHVDCNSSLVLDLITNNEKNLLNNVFIKIEECPKWTRDILYETRRKNLEEEKKSEEIRKQEELKLQRRKKILNFLNPFSR